MAENTSTMRHEYLNRHKGARTVDGGGVINDDDDDDDKDEDDKNVEEEDQDAVPLGDDIATALEPDEYLTEVIDPDEEEEDQILPTDLVLISTSTDHESHSLIVTVFDDIESMNSYNHHDYILTNLPLCLEWLDFSQGRDGNYAAVGSLNTLCIEIWDLDVLNTMEPTIALGASEPTPKQSVISLAWHAARRDLLAAGHSDATVALWSVERPEQPIHSANDVHTDGVQVVRWSPTSPTTLLSASFDGSARLHDLAAPATRAHCALAQQPEAACWLPDGITFAVAEEKGHLQLFDTRKLSAPLATMHAHAPTADVTSVVATSIDGKVVLATCATDGSLALWRANDGLTDGQLPRNTAPLTPAYQRRVAQDPLFCLDWCRDAPMLLACGGMTGFVARNATSLLVGDQAQ